ncbi:MAG: molybdopterin-dependent oxidoreductase, partial [Chloroflexota bacterium]
MSAILEQWRPLPTARYAIFHSYQNDTAGLPFYEALDIRLAGHPQTLLAYEMNDAPLAVPYGAPVRLRV